MKLRVIAAVAGAIALGLSGVATASAAPAVPSTTTQSTNTVQSQTTPSTNTLQPTRSATATPAATQADQDCTYSPVKPADRFKGLPKFDPVTAAKPYTAHLYTTAGEIDFAALTDAAPCTTFSFRFLAQRHYFDGTHCHRLTVQRIYVLQCGDPTGTGSGGPGYQYADENLAGATYPAGTVAMANAGPNTNGSQFFICWADTKLSPAYTPFGRVTRGLDVLRKIAAAGDDEQNGPGDGYPNIYVEFHHVQIAGR